eukprot:609191-Pleurochrysis_carterae.AAC.1
MSIIVRCARSRARAWLCLYARVLSGQLSVNRAVVPAPLPLTRSMWTACIRTAARVQLVSEGRFTLDI